jgi:hypothetical protein
MHLASWSVSPFFGRGGFETRPYGGTLLCMRPDRDRRAMAVARMSRRRQRFAAKTRVDRLWAPPHGDIRGAPHIAFGGRQAPGELLENRGTLLMLRLL